MKKISITSPLLLLCFIKAEAQAAPVGIYLTAKDFIQQKLSYTPVENQMHRIRLHAEFYKPFLTVFSGTTTTILLKDSVFGYRTRDDVTCRFFDRGIYTILNPGSLPLLYTQLHVPGGKSAQRITNHYFSKDASSAPLRLTKANIRTVFANDPAFVERVYGYFPDDNALAHYDDHHHAYALVRLYQNIPAANT